MHECKIHPDARYAAGKLWNVNIPVLHHEMVEKRDADLVRALWLAQVDDLRKKTETNARKQLVNTSILDAQTKYGERIKWNCCVLKGVVSDVSWWEDKWDHVKKPARICLAYPMMAELNQTEEIRPKSGRSFKADSWKQVDSHIWLGVSRLQWANGPASACVDKPVQVHIGDTLTVVGQIGEYEFKDDKHDDEQKNGVFGWCPIMSLCRYKEENGQSDKIIPNELINHRTMVLQCLVDENGFKEVDAAYWAVLQPELDRLRDLGAHKSHLLVNKRLNMMIRMRNKYNMDEV